MDTITIVDTSHSSDNLGDEIIMDSVNEVLKELFPNAYFYRVPSHECLSRRSHSFLKCSSMCFLGGTNILASSVWKLRWRDALALRDAVCVGAGWGEFYYRPYLERKLLLRRVLSSKGLHSVRDNYTRRRLEDVGRRAVSTACPTMWRLTPEHCNEIPGSKARDVIFTLSGRAPDPVADRTMIDLLRNNYRHLYFFCQMRNDYPYLASLNATGIRAILPTLAAYDQCLKNEEVDFVGSRLHGGIRALQNKKRTLIIGFDSRSLEIAKDTGLPVLPRQNIEKLADWIQSEVRTEVSLPQDGIAQWKAQFSSQLQA